MAIVEMRCPNCGGIMDLVDNQLKCRNCRTTMLNIVDAKIDADVTVMSPEEFAKKINESKRRFVVNLNDDFKVFDIDTMVINKKIQDATTALEKRKFDKVEPLLSGVPHNIFSAERLRFLAHYSVINEYELSFYDGYIDGNKHYDRLIYLADKQTKETYIKLANYCRRQYNMKRKMQSDVKEVDKLLEVKLYKEAVIYAREMCKKYPQFAFSWLYLCNVNHTADRNYEGLNEYNMMRNCVDYSEDMLPDFVRERIQKAQYKVYNYYESRNKFSWAEVLGNLYFLIFVGILFFQRNAFGSGLPLQIFLGIVGIVVQIYCGIGIIYRFWQFSEHLINVLSVKKLKEELKWLPGSEEQKKEKKTSSCLIAASIIAGCFFIAAIVLIIIFSVAR